MASHIAAEGDNYLNNHRKIEKAYPNIFIWDGEYAVCSDCDQWASILLTGKELLHNVAAHIQSPLHIAKAKTMVGSISKKISFFTRKTGPLQQDKLDKNLHAWYRYTSEQYTFRGWICT